VSAFTIKSFDPSGKRAAFPSGIGSRQIVVPHAKTIRRMIKNISTLLSTHKKGGASRSVVVTLTVGLTLIGIAIIAVLAHAPLTVVGANPIPAANFIEVEEKGKLRNCQPAGTIPQGTSAIRIGIEGLYFSPAVTIKVLQGSHVLREGHQIAGGVSAPTVTVPVSRFPRAVSGARICPTVGPALEPIRYYGVPVHPSASTAGQLESAALHVEYLRPGPKSWWSFVPSIAYHLGLGRAPSGTWVAFLVLALMLVVIVIASRLTVEELE
jgi:hypothetical protein